MIQLIRVSAAIIGLLCLSLIIPTVRATEGGSSDRRNGSAADWPHWRGPDGNGIVAGNPLPPIEWEVTSNHNIAWKAAVPGRGHSSPIVCKDRVVVTTAEEDRELQSVLCFDRATGDLLWRTDVHRGGLDKKGNKKTSQASSTAAFDGERFIVNFLNRGAVYTTALDWDGKQLWQTKVSDFATHQGFGSSPAIDGTLAFITTDSRGGGLVAGLDRSTGKIVWQVERPQKANYASAVTLVAAGRKQLLVQGCDLISSFEPTTGQKLWEIEGATTECVTTMVTDGKHVFASGGYPRKHVQAVLADGSGKTVWESDIQVYVPSMIVHGGHLYAVQDSGVATCWKCDTGEEVWKKRLGGTFSASLVMAGENIYCINESGETFIFKAQPSGFEQVAANKIGEEVFATPAIAGTDILIRVAEFPGDQRQEMLYCIRAKE